METLLILDTDVLVELERGSADALHWLNSLPQPPQICILTAMEIKFGSRSFAHLRTIEALLAPFSVVIPTDKDWSRAVNEYPRLWLSGGLGLVDAIIASTVMGLDEELITFNEKHFRNIAGLKVRKPYPR